MGDTFDLQPGIEMIVQNGCDASSEDGSQEGLEYEGMLKVFCMCCLERVAFLIPSHLSRNRAAETMLLLQTEFGSNLYVDFTS